MKNQWKWILPILMMGFFAPFTPAVDMHTASLFFQQEMGSFYNNGFFRFLYVYGEIFGIASGFVALAIWLLSWKVDVLRKWRRGALLMVATLAIGAGLITNVLFKGYWGRPRPKQVEHFGGQLAYRSFWNPKFLHKEMPQKSFPSGHAAMGFYFFSLCLVGRRYKNRPLFYLGVALTFLLGVGLMVGRVAQGGHFVSDVTFSAMLMWLVVLVLDRLIFTSAYLPGEEPGGQDENSTLQEHPQN